MSQTTTSNYSIMNEVFGPLPKQYCIYFYVFSIIGFILFLFVVLYCLYVLISNKKVDPTFYVMAITMSIQYLLTYFTYRLLYAMCVNSLH
jgi:hypothetical protein